ncbi:MAG: sulfite exporter TauE/SafE family protein [Candidatus Paceibacterota bacterium]
MDLFIIFLIGFLSSFFGNFASGITSTLSLSGLLAFGLPSHTALATHRLGLFGFDLGGIREYVKHNKIDWSLIPILSLIGIVAAIIGSNIILSVDQELLSKLLGIVILFFIPIMLLKPHLGLVSWRNL